MAPRLLPVQRQTIIALHKAGTKVIDISRWTGITRKSIYTWLKRHEETGSLAELHRQNYKKSTTNEQDTQIIAQHMYNPSQSTIATATQYNVSPRTIRRRLLDAGVRQKRERKKPTKPRAPKQPAAPKTSKKKPAYPPEAPTDAWPYKCNTCGDIFRVRADLQNHNRVVHLGLGPNAAMDKDKKKLAKKGLEQETQHMPPQQHPPPQQQQHMPQQQQPTQQQLQQQQHEIMLHEQNSMHSDHSSLHGHPIPMTMAGKKSHEPLHMSSCAELPIPMMMAGKKAHEHNINPNFELPIPMMMSGKRMHEQTIGHNTDLPIPMMMNNRKTHESLAGPSSALPIPMMMGRPLWGAHYAFEHHNAHC